MNLYGYWVQPVHRHILDIVNYYGPSYRPLGAAFYLPLYSFFGFNPLPFRLVCFGLILANVGLLGNLSKQLTGSRKKAAVIALSGAYHPALAHVYYNTGTIYDLLCFFFFFATLSYYAFIRQQRRFPSPRETFALILLQVAALDSKEMAVTIPLVVLVLECFPQGTWRALSSTGTWLTDLANRGRTAFWLVAVTIPYVFGKLSGGSAFSSAPGYALEVPVARYLENYGAYLERIFYVDGVFTPARVVALLGLLLLVALLSRQRHLQIAWALLTLTFLPIAFIDVRGPTPSTFHSPAGPCMPARSCVPPLTGYCASRTFRRGYCGCRVRDSGCRLGCGWRCFC